MRKATGLIALIFFMALPAMSADVPEAEVFGGFAYQRADIRDANLSLKGWNFSVSQNVNNWFGGVADFTGHYAQPLGINVHVHSFMYGPRFAFRKVPNVTPFGHVLLGAVRGSKGYLGLSDSKVEFGAAFGGGIDVKVHRVAAIRLIQADYMITPFLGLRQDNLRFSAGFVFYLGEK